MRGRRGLLLGMIGLLAACHTVAPGRTQPSPSARPGVLSTSPTVKPSGTAATPSAVASADRTATPAVAAGPDLLKPGSGSVHTLSGTATLDPRSSVVASALLKAKDGTAIASLGAGLISDQGGELIVGGAIVANNAGNVIPGSASGIAATQGGNALATNDRLVSSGILSNNGGGLISDHGGGIISNNGSARRLLSTAEPVPLAGMLVSAVSLETGAYVPLGVNGAGKPVYVVYTGLNGGYTLYLPADLVGNLVVTVSAPPQAKSPVTLDALSAAGSTEPVLANAAADQATHLIRQTFALHMADYLTGTLHDALIDEVKSSNPTVARVLAPGLATMAGKVNARAIAVGVPQGPAAARLPAVRELAQRLTDYSLSLVDLGQLKTGAPYTPEWGGAPESTYAALAASFGAMNDAAGAYIAANAPNAVATLAIDTRNLDGASLPYCPAHVRVPLQDPTDLCTYALAAYVGDRNNRATGDLARAFSAVAVPPLPAGLLDTNAEPSDAAFDLPNNPGFYVDATTGKHLLYANRVRAASLAIFGAVLQLLLPVGGVDPPALLKGYTLVDAFTQANASAATPAPDLDVRFPLVPCAGATGAVGASAATSP